MNNFWLELHKPFTVLAPMDDVTDNVFRQVVLEAGRPDVFFTEFVSSDGLVFNSHGIPLRKLTFTSDQHPIVAQIWGTVPRNMKKAAKIVADLGFDGVDINMGCPVREVMKRGAGAGLIGNYDLSGEIIKSVKKGAGALPVSVKTRLGAFPADWEEIGEIVKIKDKIAPNTIIIGNGDVKSYIEVVKKAQKYGVDGVMIGRGIFVNPWVFSKDSGEHTKAEYIKLLLRHMELFEKTWGGTKNFAIIKKFFKMYINNFKGASILRQKLMEAKSFEEIKSFL
ncbi:MAG: tRNA-dihydrouridine synthase [Candidatus Woesebacteria bacterium GW2011_GWA2_40_7]|uniref:tRNA-dihydrouridine synthase n=1 Tax=Candidatus Woesebacteria bacterium GW2011_GWA2_40_7 TaxID=1618562 RepID=A0A0G0TFT7_9BACT|nr:MAG: tRNA-dihydrouridine synthase [Candidatus Woesebacteria bacterium GW2011_GWA2_40_7]